MEKVRKDTERCLESFLARKRSETQSLAANCLELVDSVSALTLRGGKRTRPMVLAAGYHCIDPSMGRDLSRPYASLELLQSYLLIHDDWMDRDEQRRGGPAVWAVLRDAHQDTHLGASLAILAGNLASAFASELLADSDFPPELLKEALDAFWRIQREVFFGQHLDLVADPEIEQMYDLKTGSYTVRGPLRIGAILAGATAPERHALDRIAAPLGIAFQLRDELLGTFGDPGATGKPAGNDLREGKLTVLIQEARTRMSQGDLQHLEAVWGNREATDGDVEGAMEQLVAAGAKAAVEAKLTHYREATESAIRDAPFHSERLDDIVQLLVHRDH